MASDLCRQQPLCIGLPKGRLLPRSRALLQGFGMLYREGVYRYVDRGGIFAAHLLKLRDIPTLVAEGVLHAGITSDAWLAEIASPKIVQLADLDWCATRIVAMESRMSGGSWIARDPVRVVTEYPRTTHRFLGDAGVNFSLTVVNGASECCVPLLADMVVDCVETGETARRHDLYEVKTLLRCRARVIANSTALADHGEGFATFLRHARDA